MAIEFRCTQCGRLLRTGDDTAGKPAQCPECGAVTTVPTAATEVPPPSGSTPGSPFAPGGGSPFAPGGPQPGQPGEPQNPYQSPTQYGAAPPYAGVDPAVASRVAGPSTALIVTAGIDVAINLLAMLRLLSAGAAVMVLPGLMGGPNMAPPIVLNATTLAIGYVINMIIGVVIIVGAVKMKNLENYAFAMAAAIISMIPCIYFPCCILGLPFGIWALVVLSDPSVKSAFRS